MEQHAAFPTGFVWGAGTAAYQVEGAFDADGRGLSVWDRFCRRPGAVWGGQSGDVACDHYNRVRDDIALMQAIGLNAYRFSIAWPRIFPDGTGALNERGLDWYDRLVDALLAAGITPYVTLFHWDYPDALYCRGGWLNPDSPAWFAAYTEAVVRRLSDRVQHWFTLNEVQVFLGAGHRIGLHAPGDRLDLPYYLRAVHHALLAHGSAVQAIRASSHTPAQIGWSPSGRVCIPATLADADIAAARELMFSVQPGVDDWWNNTWYCDPLVFKRYPADGLELFGAAVPTIGPNDMELIGQPLDFFGVNVYYGDVVRAGVDGRPEVVPQTEFPQTTYAWPVTPEALEWGPRLLWERYSLPLLITENGIANTDWPARDGTVHDPQRIDFTARYLEALQRAIGAGVDVRGYFHWSLLDNFEWNEGYKLRFGLVYVDYMTQQRILKQSAHWYRQVIASNGTHLEPL